MLKTYNFISVDPNRQPYSPVIPIDAEDKNWDGMLYPGQWVKERFDGGQGIVVAIDSIQVTILWSIEPSPANDFSKFAFPLVRQTFPSLRVNDLVSIQPMSKPSGLIFYLDYTYGSGSINNTTKAGI